EDAEADLERLRASSSLELYGINIQYPWNRLILAGVKTIEVCKYPLGRNRSFIEDHDLFLIETPGRRSTQDADCLLERGYKLSPELIGRMEQEQLGEQATNAGLRGRYDWMHLVDRPIFGWVVGGAKEVEPMLADTKTMLRLKGHFAQCGEVAYAGVFGPGEVWMATPAEAEEAVNQLNGAEVDGQEISVRIDETSNDFRKLIVNFLPPHVQWQELKDLFRTVGEVKHAVRAR
ncbi:unnamed protein product, partial [Symbiodinium sp. CCMP2592]